MVDVLIRPTEPADVELLCANLRASDLAECEAYDDSDVPGMIRRSFERSVLCWSGFVDGELCAVIGVTPWTSTPHLGAPWMLGTPALNRHSRVLVRGTPSYIARMLDAFPHLLNFVHARNTTSVRWLRRLGFHLHAPQHYGTRGEFFHRFEMRKPAHG